MSYLITPEGSKFLASPNGVIFWKSPTLTNYWNTKNGLDFAMSTQGQLFFNLPDIKNNIIFNINNSFPNTQVGKYIAVFTQLNAITNGSTAAGIQVLKNILIPQFNYDPGNIFESNPRCIPFNLPDNPLGSILGTPIISNNNGATIYTYKSQMHNYILSLKFAFNNSYNDVQTCNIEIIGILTIDGIERYRIVTGHGCYWFALTPCYSYFYVNPISPPVKMRKYKRLYKYHRK